MLWNRTRRAVNSNQGLMAAEQSPLLSPSHKRALPISSLLGSPRIFKGFLGGTQSGAENCTTISPTSILDGKQSLNSVSPCGFDRTLNLNPNPNSNPSTDSGVGLAALINSLDDGDNVDISEANSGRIVLFGSKLKVQIPSLPISAISPAGSPKSPADFGINTPRKAQFFSSCLLTKESPRKADELSLSEMELSEDYTCVIIHGPNPRTTHVFDDCIVESCCGIVRLSELRKDDGFRSDQSTFPPVDSLNFCPACNIEPGDSTNIYMHGGEKSVCSSYECPCEEMLSEGSKKLGMDDDDESFTTF